MIAQCDIAFLLLAHVRQKCAQQETDRQTETATETEKQRQRQRQRKVDIIDTRPPTSLQLLFWNFPAALRGSPEVIFGAKFAQVDIFESETLVRDGLYLHIPCHPIKHESPKQLVPDIHAPGSSASLLV